MSDQGKDEIRQAVREHYAKVAEEGSGCGCGVGCCGTNPSTSLALGYSTSDLEAVPDGANLGLGCGNPQALAALRPGVFREVFRVLRPGGRIALSDVVATAPLPPEIADRVAAYTACVAGAVLVDDLLVSLEDAGFTGISIRVVEASRAMIREWMPGTGAEQYVASASIEAVKPGAPGT